MAKVWSDLAGTVQSMLKFGVHRIMSYNDENDALEKVAIQDRYGTSSIFEVGPLKVTTLGKNIYSSSTQPAVGNYLVGDIVLNTDIVDRQVLGWICVSSGAPGEWLSIGNSITSVSNVIESPILNKPYFMVKTPQPYRPYLLTLKCKTGAGRVRIQADEFSIETSLDDISLSSSQTTLSLDSSVVISSGSRLTITVFDQLLPIEDLEYTLSLVQ